MPSSVALSSFLDFKSLTKISLTASLISGICAYILALNNFGVWALVLQQLMRSMIVKSNATYSTQ
jgi:hypothetical protein